MRWLLIIRSIVFIMILLIIIVNIFWYLLYVRVRMLVMVLFG